MFTVEPDWRSGPFVNAWGVVADNLQDEKCKYGEYVTYFKKAFGIQLRLNNETEVYQWADFESEGHYLLFMLEFS